MMYDFRVYNKIALAYPAHLPVSRVVCTRVTLFTCLHVCERVFEFVAHSATAKAHDQKCNP